MICFPFRREKSAKLAGCVTLLTVAKRTGTAKKRESLKMRLLTFECLIYSSLNVASNWFHSIFKGRNIQTIVIHQPNKSPKSMVFR